MVLNSCINTSVNFKCLWILHLSSHLRPKLYLYITEFTLLCFHNSLVSYFIILFFGLWWILGNLILMHLYCWLVTRCSCSEWAPADSVFFCIQQHFQSYWTIWNSSYYCKCFQFCMSFGIQELFHGIMFMYSAVVTRLRYFSWAYWSIDFCVIDLGMVNIVFEFEYIMFTCDVFAQSLCVQSF